MRWSTVILVAGFGCSGPDDPAAKDTSPAAPVDTDADDDGVDSATDCDDQDAAVGGPTEWYIDDDDDGFGTESAATRVDCDPVTGFVDNAADCDDGDPDVNPAAPERCNDVDDNCDGAVDGADAVDATPWCEDADGDGYGDGDACVTACDAPPGYVDDSSDCDDGSVSLGPATPTNDLACGSCDVQCDALESCVGGECIEACSYPEVDVDAGSTGGPDTMDPAYVAIGFFGIAEGGMIHDGVLDGEEFSAAIEFTWYDDAFTVLCTSAYDASNATPAAYSSDSGGAITQVWDLDLTAGADDCGPFDPSSGLTSPDDLVLALPWAVGFGPSSAAFAGDLEAAVTDAGLDWDAEWAPYVFSMYVAFDGTVAYELGYAFAFETACDEVLTDGAGGGVLLPGPPTAPLEGAYQGAAYYVLSL